MPGLKREAWLRVRPGHPRLGRTKDVDGRDQPGHDDEIGSIQLESALNPAAAAMSTHVFGNQTLNVIASSCEAIQSHEESLDCFVARAPRKKLVG
jgi:hypothetical protein